MGNKVKIFIFRILPLLTILLIWQFSIQNEPQLIFYFGLPSKICSYILNKTMDGTLVYDFFITLSETIIGFLVGNIIGTLIGLSLWFSKLAFLISKPYIIALGSAPIFALAPLMIIWFGTGIFSKIMMATLSTVFIALMQSYSGAAQVDKNYLKLMKTINSTKLQIFKKLVAPSSIVWVISAFRINTGFALLGAFIGEYISSNSGLGHLIIVASGLFDISLVLTGVIMLMVISLSLNYLIGKLEIPLRKAIVSFL